MNAREGSVYSVSEAFCVFSVRSLLGVYSVSGNYWLCILHSTWGTASSAANSGLWHLWTEGRYCAVLISLLGWSRPILASQCQTIHNVSGSINALGSINGDSISRKLWTSAVDSIMDLFPRAKSIPTIINKGCIDHCPILAQCSRFLVCSNNNIKTNLHLTQTYEKWVWYGENFHIPWVWLKALLKPYSHL